MKAATEDAVNARCSMRHATKRVTSACTPTTTKVVWSAFSLLVFLLLNMAVSSRFVLVASLLMTLSEQKVKMLRDWCGKMF